MSDYNEELSELHQWVIQRELDLPATIDEDGYVQFIHPSLGECEITLREYHPEYMNITCRLAHDGERKQEDLIRICNKVNGTEFSKLWVSDSGFVRVVIALFVAAPRKEMTIKGKLLPDEELLRAIYPHAMSLISDAVQAFTTELSKLP